MRMNGISDNFARKQMRHQTIRQTDGYMDEAQPLNYDSIKNLPKLGGNTKIRAQAQKGNAWRNLSQLAKGRKVVKRL